MGNLVVTISWTSLGYGGGNAESSDYVIRDKLEKLASTHGLSITNSNYGHYIKNKEQVFAQAQGLSLFIWGHDYWRSQIESFKKKIENVCPGIAFDVYIDDLAI